MYMPRGWAGSKKKETTFLRKAGQKRLDDTNTRAMRRRLSNMAGQTGGRPWLGSQSIYYRG